MIFLFGRGVANETKGMINLKYFKWDKIEIPTSNVT